MLVNLLLLRGNIGKPGAGICPVRGHSNVQGQRTVGITEKPELVPLDKLRELYDFEPPREKGLNTVEACEGILDGRGEGLRRPRRQLPARHPRYRPDGAGLAQPAPHRADLDQAQPLPPRERRGRLHPALPRPDRDRPAGERAAGGLDGGFHRAASTAPGACPTRSDRTCARSPGSWRRSPRRRCRPTRGSTGMPGSPITAACATPSRRPTRRCSTTSTGGCSSPAGSPSRSAPATGSGRRRPARPNFAVPAGLEADPDLPARGRDVLDLITLRSNDQFNTTVYGYDDRFRGVKGTRDGAVHEPRRHRPARARRMAAASTSRPRPTIRCPGASAACG